ncbi:hypothetical protein GCM10007169_31990 [Shewanella fodinae]|nr:hypothetical protein GCM10007169_31990 [Shewanella fodinae]
MTNLPSCPFAPVTANMFVLLVKLLNKVNVTGIVPSLVAILAPTQTFGKYIQKGKYNETANP